MWVFMQTTNLRSKSQFANTLNLIIFNILDWIGGLRRHALNQSIAKDGATLRSPALAHVVPYYRY